MNNENEEFQNLENTNSNSNNTNETNTTNSTTTTEVVVSLDESEQLQLIHEDLGFICSFIIFFVIVLLCRYAYKFFDMFFKI